MQCNPHIRKKQKCQYGQCFSVICFFFCCSLSIDNEAPDLNTDSFSLSIFWFIFWSFENRSILQCTNILEWTYIRKPNNSWNVPQKYRRIEEMGFDSFWTVVRLLLLFLFSFIMVPPTIQYLFIHFQLIINVVCINTVRNLLLLIHIYKKYKIQNLKHRP